MRVRTGSWLLLLISLAAGFAGGLLVVWLVLGSPVVAEETVSQSPAVLSAQEFRLMDHGGNLVPSSASQLRRNRFLPCCIGMRLGLSG